MPHPPRTIGVWQTAFFGDTVLTLPLLQTLRREFPDSTIRLFVRKGLAGIFAGHPEYVVEQFDKRGADAGLQGAWRYGRKLAKTSFDAWLSPHTSLRSAIVSAAVGAPTRIGYSRPWWNKLAYNTVIDRRFGEGHEAWRIARLAHGFGISRLETWPELRPAPQAMEKAQELWREAGLCGAQPVVGLNPASIWPTKRWPAAHFGQLADMLAKEGYRVALFAAPGEEHMTQEVLAAAMSRDAITDLSGKLSIPLLIACMSYLSAYVSNDSGPMHAAWAMRVPVVGIFGPTVEHFGFFPQGETSLVAQLPMDCRPCRIHGSTSCPRGHHRCMRELEPRSVLELTRRAMELKRGN